MAKSIFIGLDFSINKPAMTILYDKQFSFSTIVNIIGAPATLTVAASNDKVKISGFIENLRDKKSMQFIVIKDITGKIQVTVEKEKMPQIAETFSSVIVGSVVSVIGTVVENEWSIIGHS